MQQNEVHLYIADIKDCDANDLFKEYALKMDKERLLRIGRCKNVKEKQRLIATGVLLCNVLGEYGMECEDVEYAENGKPYIPNNQGIFFNISHSGAYVVVAVSGQCIGVDIQKPVSFSNVIFERICSLQERTMVKEDGNIEFNYIWSLKEAAVKLTGHGLTKDFKKITFSFTENNPEIFDDGKHLGYSEVSVIEEGYSLAVVCREKFTVSKLHKYVY